MDIIIEFNHTPLPSYLWSYVKLYLYKPVKHPRFGISLEYRRYTEGDTNRIGFTQAGRRNTDTWACPTCRRYGVYFTTPEDKLIEYTPPTFQVVANNTFEFVDISINWTQYLPQRLRCISHCIFKYIHTQIPPKYKSPHHNHDLSLHNYLNYYGHICDLCGRSPRNDQLLFSCVDCDYDLCENCFSRPNAVLQPLSSGDRCLDCYITL